MTIELGTNTSAEEISKCDVVVAFLGGPRDAEKLSPSELSPARGYYDTTYRFTEKGEVYDFPTAFAGRALAEWCKPSKNFIVLGTRDSLWSLLLPQEINPDGLSEEQKAVMETVRASETKIDEHILASLQTILNNEPKDGSRLTYKLHLIEPGHDADPAESLRQQQHMLEYLHEAVPRNAKVYIDITHGLRSFPLLGLVSMLYLKSVSAVEISGIYYGAYDLRTETASGSITPMVDQSGLLGIIAWVEALYAFKKYGDFAEFAPLLKGIPNRSIEQLKTGAHWERVNRVDKAEKSLERFSETITAASLTGPAALFKSELEKELSVWKKQDSDDIHPALGLYRKQRSLAIKYLKVNDALRGTLLGYESVITGLFLRVTKTYAGGFSNYQIRKDLESQASNLKDSTFRDINGDFITLKTIRNSFAHGLAQTKEEGEALEKRLNKNSTKEDTICEIRKLLKKLAPKYLGQPSKNK